MSAMNAGAYYVNNLWARADSKIVNVCMSNPHTDETIVIIITLLLFLL